VLHKRFVLTRFTTSKLTDFTEHEFEISPQTALWYKNNKDNDKDIFTRKRLSGKRRPFNTHQKVPFGHSLFALSFNSTRLRFVSLPNT
jgi:hypothetical protein